MLLYIIYNNPLIQVANPNNHNESTIGFIDDIILLATCKDFKLAHKTNKDMMELKNSNFEWSSTYDSLLEMNKLALVNFTQSATMR
jgi:hypothetical protein